MLREKLGSGAFGGVFKCTWRGRELAVNMYRDGVLGVSPAEKAAGVVEALRYNTAVFIDLPLAGMAEDMHRQISVVFQTRSLRSANLAEVQQRSRCVR